MKPIKKTWFERNLAWLIPSIILVVVSAIFLFVVMIMHFMKSSGAFELCIEELRKSEQVSEIVGDSWNEPLFVKGNVSVTGNSGNAQFVFKIKGEETDVRVYSTATKSGRLWSLNILAIIPEDGKAINLLNEN